MQIRKYELLVGATLALALGLCLPYFLSYYVYGDYSGREHESEVVIPVSGGGLNLPAIDAATPTPGTPFAPQFVLIATDGPLSLLPGLATSTPTARPTSTLVTSTPTNRPRLDRLPTSTLAPPPTAIRPTNTLPPPTASSVPTHVPTATPVIPSKTATIPFTATTKPPTRTPTATTAPSPTNANTPVPPPTDTNTPLPPPPTDTNTPVPPDTNTPAPPPDTATPEPATLEPPPTDVTPAAILQVLPWELGSAKTAREKPLTFI